MNWLQIHLAVVHLPVLGLPAAAALLVLALARQDERLQTTALWLPVLLAAAAGLAYASGGYSYEALAPVWAMTAETGEATRALAESHAVAGRAGFFGLVLLGAFALQLRLQGFQGQRPKRGAVIALAVLCAALGLLLAWIAHQGGLVGHPELR